MTSRHEDGGWSEGRGSVAKRRAQKPLADRGRLSDRPTDEAAAIASAVTTRAQLIRSSPNALSRSAAVRALPPLTATSL